jgi:uncharacterized membrane protein
MAYCHWMEFEEFPRFMAGVESVKRLDSHLFHWVVRIGEQRREWIARITDILPHQRIAWRSEAGEVHAGVVTFHLLAPCRTRIVVRLEYEPEGVVEAIGDQLGLVSRRVETDLRCFKDFIEARPREGREPCSTAE